MKIKLLNDNINLNKPIQEIIFTNRGIPTEDISHFLKTTDEDILDYNLLDNMDKALDCFINHYKNKSKILIQVD